jgi:hypothetical protein
LTTLAARSHWIRRSDYRPLTVAGGGTGAFTEGAVAASVALARPAGVAVDGTAKLYLGERGLNQILKMSPSGLLTTMAGTWPVKSRRAPHAGQWTTPR